MIPQREPSAAPQARAAHPLREFIARNRFLLVFCPLCSLMGVSVGIAQVSASLYAVSLGASDTMLGLIAGAKSIGVLVMGVPIGMGVDRWGPSRLFVLGSALACAIYTLLPLYPTPGFLLLCTLLISFFMPLRFIPLNTVFLQQLASLGEAKAGWYRATHMVGMFLLGPVIGERCIAAFGFAATYWLVALAFAATSVFAPVVFRSGAATAPPRAPRPQPWSALRGLLRDRALRRLSALESLTQATNSYYAFVIVVVAVQELGLSPREASGFVAANGLSFIFALFALGGWVRRWGPLLNYLASFALIGAALGVLGVAVRPAPLWCAGLALGLGLGTLQIANLTGFSRAAARSGPGAVSGLNALVGPCGGLLGSALGSLVGRTLGLQAGFLVLAGVFALAGAALLAGERGQPR